MFCRKNEDDSQIDNCPVYKALHALGDEIRLLFEYIREWNTEPKLCQVAQIVNFRAFQILPPTEISEIKGIGEILEGIYSYAQRHKSRIERLERSTFLLDYTLTRMSVFEPETGSRDLANGSSSQTVKNVDDSLKDNPDWEQKQPSEDPKAENSSKKRKSHKSGDGSRTHKKKVKDVAYTKVEAISLRA